MALRFIGTGKTDNTGVAVMNKNANGTSINHSYTGIGAGEVDFIAKYTIDNSILVSETYSILDCIFYDDGVTDPKTATWYDPYNRITVAIDNTGTKISTSTGNDHYWANNNTAITGNFICEFDLLEYADSRGVSLRFYDGTNNHYYIFNDKSLTGENHLRFVYDGSKISVQINDGTPTNFVNTSTGSYYIALRLNSVNDNLKYRNFKIYPI